MQLVGGGLLLQKQPRKPILYLMCLYCGVIVQIRGALASLEGLQQPVDVRIIRDHVTSASRGFCFLEFSTGEITSMALRKMLEQTPAFFVDGKRITVTFARGNNPKSMGTHKVANAAIAQAQWSMSLAPQLNSNPGQTQTSQQVHI
jgi:hypothetical protein